ncbi:MAG: 30S ribosomal protein S30 [Thermoproteota archaeon]|nr:MAG: 30S ribosomal protein S30 [Candidatus Korarchaeota archaeon]
MPRGTHGALNKAGKVRSLTSKIERRPRKNPSPRVKIRAVYKRRFILGIEPGQVVK